ncbi:MAG: helix-turn-helix transcriptional regulator, partial [Bacillota bacterium]
MGKCSQKAGRMIKLISLTAKKHATYSRQELLNVLGVSESTFYRDLKELREVAEVPINYDHQSNGYKIREDYYMPAPDLTVSEALALIVGGNVLLNSSQLPFYNEINMAITKLNSVLPARTKELLGTIEERINFNLNTLVDYSEYEDIFFTLDQATNEQTNVWVEYYSESRGEVTERVISPYLLQFNDGLLYLIGYCHLRQQVLVFRVDRIREIELRDGRFKDSQDFSISDYLGNAWGVERREEDMEVKLEFSAEIANWVKKHQYHATQEIEELADGRLIMEFTTCSINEIKQWILGFGADV